MWSPELETLDQLLGGDMPLVAIRALYPSHDQFVAAVSAMLHADEVRMLAETAEVPKWRWANSLAIPESQIKLAITEMGAKRIA